MIADAEKFWARVRKSSGCWEWSGARNAKGYGYAHVGRQMVAAHRISFALSGGVLSPGLCVCHRCDNPGCVRPDHLFLGSHGDNARDRESKGRGCRGVVHPRARVVEMDGLRLTITEWARRMGVHQNTIYGRLNRHGWSVHEAITAPARSIRHTRRAP